MDIKQIKEEKEKVEETIHQLLTNFTVKTGLVVEDINLEIMNQIGFEELQYISVNLDVRI